MLNKVPSRAVYSTRHEAANYRFSSAPVSRGLYRSFCRCGMGLLYHRHLHWNASVTFELQLPA